MTTDHGTGLAQFGAFEASGSGHAVISVTRHGSGTSRTGRFHVNADGNIPSNPSAGTVLLFRPPTVKITTLFGGTRALRYSYNQAETVWQDSGGNWLHQQTPPHEVLAAASRLLSVGGRPEIVDQETADELVAAGVGTVQEIPREDAGQWLPQ